MSMPFAMPDWLPWWVPLAVLVPVLLYLAVFLLMPFSVFGVKGRLDLIDARLDEIQGEIRSLALRLRAAPEPRNPDPAAEHPPIPPAPSPDEAPRSARPSAAEDEWRDREDDMPRRMRGPGGRSEPRLDWPP